MNDYVQSIIRDYELPDLPEESSDSDAVDLVLFRQNDSNVVIAESVSLSDARAYATDEDTHGDGWFVGYRK